MRITWMFRSGDIYHDPLRESDANNPNGGVCSKAIHLARAAPQVNTIANIDQSGDICFAETLWFQETGELINRVEQWVQLKAYKILANSDLALLRMPGQIREQLIDASDIVIATSEYGLQLFSAITQKATLLYDPIDIDMFVPATNKDRSIYGAGQVAHVKNSQFMIDLFNRLPSIADIKKVYIGSSQLWGPRKEADFKLERALELASDTMEKGLDRREFAHRIARMWAFAADTGYDMASFSMMEAMLCGCWIFVGRHLLYNERPCIRFNTADEAATKIVKHLEETPPDSGVINEEGRQFIVDRHRFTAFRRDLTNLIGRHGFGL